MFIKNNFEKDEPTWKVNKILFKKSITEFEYETFPNSWKIARLCTLFIKTKYFLNTDLKIQTHHRLTHINTKNIENI